MTHKEFIEKYRETPGYGEKWGICRNPGGTLVLAETLDFSHTPESQAMEAAWPGPLRILNKNTLVGAVDCLDEYPVDMMDFELARTEPVLDFRESMLKDLRDLWADLLEAKKSLNYDPTGEYLCRFSRAMCEASNAYVFLEHSRPVPWPMYRPWTPGTEGGGAP